MPFAPGFLWGVSASGFQFEMGMPGGEDAGSDWFVWVHDRRNIQNKVVSGDFPEHGPGYWHFFREDHSLAARLGLNAYRLGVEWSRVFPRSTKNVEVMVERNRFGRISRITADEKTIRKLEEYADVKALNHYREIIRDVAAKKMEPVVCLNHFTLPLWVHDPVAVRNSKGRKGPRGWVDEETVIEFWKFAAFVASRLGDLVDRWATFNEPGVVAEAGYLFPGWGFPPGLNSFTFFRRCLANIAVAHARAYEAIKQFDTVEARPGNKAADVGLILNIIPMQPLQKDRDAEAAEAASHIHNHFFLQAAVNGWVDENLNRLTEAREKDGDVGGRLDWVGVNYYSRNVVRGKSSLAAKVFAGLSVVPETVEGYGNSCKPNNVSAEGYPTSDFGWEIYPSGLEAALKLVAKYGKPLYVTENGVADAADRLRPTFIREHLHVLENVVEKEKLDVRGYFHWALIDNYEWAAGFRMRFGLCFVDMETKQRKPRKSFETYRTIIEANTSF
ncbi:MAG: beta-galactosidase BgaS [Candidatus Caldarchaeum sp.]|nr:beta-galactosidase BgaS [Candidatus Caldarchaeum sp.]MCX8200626.1 beta-galactosidase BgaS [Candidatus Caldarchaeum sp.]MDW8435319.1 beta-galactosidase BgaS [Candidatus Caldarchaeum sp.]